MSSEGPTHTAHGRINQKLRTRRALLSAARTLMERGVPVTIGAVARQAAVSTATAYRYFSQPDALMREAVLDRDLSPAADLLETLQETLRGVDDVETRVLLVNRHLFAFTRRNEAAYRVYLAESLQQAARGGTRAADGLRGGRRIPMFELALAPVRALLPARAFRDLVHGLAAASAIETYVVLKDVCRLPESEIDRIAESNLRAIVRAGLERCRPALPGA